MWPLGNLSAFRSLSLVHQGQSAFIGLVVVIGLCFGGAFADAQVSPGCNTADSPCTTSGSVVPSTGPSNTPSSAGEVDIGDGGAGSLTITGGTYYAQPLDVGVGSPDTGTVTQSGGTLNDNAIIGDAGTGSYSLSGGSQIVQDTLILGNQSTGVGTYNLSGSGALTIDTGDNGAPGSFVIGNVGIGTFTQTGGSVVAGQASGTGYAGEANELFNVFVGNAANSMPSSYSLTSSNQSAPSSFTVNGNLNLGVGPGAIGNMTIGTSGLTSDATSLTVNNDPWNTNLGGNILVGVSGSSTVNQNNGNVTVANDIALGVQSGSSGIWDMSGGTVTTTSLEVGGSETFSNPGGGGLGIFTQTGGVTTIGAYFGGQVLANGVTVPGGTPPSTEGPGVLGTLIVGAQNGIALYELGTGSTNGVGNQTNTTPWGGYPFTPFTTPPAFNSFTNAPYLQIYGNAIIGADNSIGTFILAGDGSTLNINNVVGYSNQGTMVVGASGNGTFDQTDQTTVYLDGSVAIGLNQGGTGIYNLTAGDSATGGSLSVGGDLEIGGSDHIGDPIAQTTQYGGTGTFNQSAGTVDVTGNLVIGTDGDGTNDGYGTGTYNLNGGTLTVSGAGYIGNNGGTGTVNQIAGSTTFDQGMFLGTDPASSLGGGPPPAATGTYNLGSTSNPLSPTLEVYENATLGWNAYATGTLNIAGDGTSASFNQTACCNSNNGGNLIVGQSGNGIVTQTDQSTVYLDNDLLLGLNQGSTGSYTLSATSIAHGANNGYNLYVGGDLDVGGMITDESGNGFQTTTVGGTGTFTQLSGDAYVVGNLNIGNLGGVGTYTQNGGTMTTGGLGLGNGLGGMGTYNLNLGILTTLVGYIDGGNGFGTFNQAGGTFNVGFLNVGILGGGTGTYTMTGGNLDVGANLGVGGSDAQGTFNQSSGTTVQVGGSLYVNNDSTSLTTGGTYSLSGGSLTVSSDAYIGNASGGNPGTGGLFDQTGGTANYEGNLHVGYESGDTGTYDLTGGSIATVSGTTVVGDAGTGTFLNDASTHNTEVLVLGAQNGSMGTYTLQDGGALNVGAVGDSGFFDVAENGTATFTQTGGTTTIIGAFDIGRCGAVATATCNKEGSPYTGNAGTGTVNLSGGSITVIYDSATMYGGFTKVGDAGTGYFNIGNGASFTSNSLDLGLDGGTGYVTVGTGYPKDATTTVTLESLGVGDNGTGTFTQNAGTVQVNGGGLAIGTNAPYFDGYAELPVGTGQYNLNGGALNVTGGEYIGAAGQGTFDQTGGTNNADSVTIGNNTGGNGTYKLSGSGILMDSGTLYIGASGTGDLQQSGGTITAVGLSMGNNSDGFGSYELSGGSITINGTSYLGGATGATGIVTQTGGTASLEGDVILGNAAGSEGQYNLLGSTHASLTISGNLDIAAATASSGSFYFNYNVGTSTPGGNATLAFANSGSELIIGDQGTGLFEQGGGDLNLAAQGVTLDIGAKLGSSGAYYLAGGTLEDDLIVGDAGGGAFTNTGGTHTVSGNLVIGNQSTGVGTYTLGGTGNLTLSDAGADIILGNMGGTPGAQGTFLFNVNPLDAGTITFNPGASQQIIVGNNGTGVFTQGGGDLNLYGNGVGIDIAAKSGSFGTFNLQGGTLETGSLNVGDGGTGYFYQSGGTGTINGNLVVGNQTNSTGEVSVGGPGATSLTVTGNATIGNNGYGSFDMGSGATVDIKGSMTIAATAAAGGAAIEGGSLTVGDGGSGNELLITANGSMKIEDSNGVGASVTVDGALVNNNTLSLGLHDVATPATLTVTQGFQNNGGFNFEANSVLNANVTNGSTTNTTAYFSAQNGAGTNVTLNGNMSNYATVNVSELGLSPSTFTENGTFTNNAGGKLQVTDGNVTITGQSGNDSLDNAGTVTITNDPNGGTTPPYQPSTVALNNNVTNGSASNGAATVNIEGSIVTITGTGNASPALDNFGTFEIGIGNNGQGSTLTVNGNTTNEVGATITVSSSQATWNGLFTNNGAYSSDPSTNKFTQGLTVGTTGSLTGTAGDVFDVTGAFINNSTQNAIWNTTLSTLEFSGTTDTLQLSSTELDKGYADTTGYTNNFAWGTLELDSGVTLDLTGPASVDSGLALYVGDLMGLDIVDGVVTNIISDDFNIYYDPLLDPGLDDLQYLLADGGYLTPIGFESGPPPPPVPEPNSLLLLGGGLVGLIFVRRMGRSKSARFVR